MVSSLSDTLETACMSLLVIEKGTDRPSENQLSELDDAVVSRFGWAFRFGMGASESLNDYRYGYIVPGKTLHEDTIEKIRSDIQDTTLDNPDVILKPVIFPEEDVESMKKLGNLPHEVLGPLQDLRDRVEDQVED